ncbi:hypothetical protein GCM10009795_040210 [Nocardioides hankookensis]|uniref:Uncharacterized protein n=1 Tax=Nocardioides hankookensis TaxID=443157 RepID=A0ABW1LPQ5_9ACTN
MRGGEVWLVLLLSAMGVLGLALCLTPATYWLTTLRERIHNGHQAELEADAAAFGEPTREQVEIRTDDDARLFGDGRAYFDSVRFEAEVLADLADYHASKIRLPAGQRATFDRRPYGLIGSNDTDHDDRGNPL